MIKKTLRAASEVALAAVTVLAIVYGFAFVAKMLQLAVNYTGADPGFTFDEAFNRTLLGCGLLFVGGFIRVMFKDWKRDRGQRSVK